MSTEVTPDVKVYFTAQKFLEVNGMVSDVSVQRLGFLAAASCTGYEIPDDVPTSIVIGQRQEVLPFLAMDRTEIFGAGMLNSSNPQSFMLRGLGQTNVLAFYMDHLTTEAASYGLAAAMQADEIHELRVGTAMDIALGLTTASSSFAVNYFGAPNAATAIFAATGFGALIRRRQRHASGAGHLIATRAAAAAHQPIIVKPISSATQKFGRKLS